MKSAINNSRLIHRLFSLVLLASTLAGALPIAAQTRRPATQRKTAATQSKPNPYDPNLGWSGIVTYTKTLNDSFQSDEPVMGRIDKQRNRIKWDKTRTYRYEGRFFLDGSSGTNVTNTQVSLSDEEREKGRQVIVDSCHAFNDEHEFIDDSSDEKITKAFAEGAADGFSFRAGFLDGRYYFSFRFPDAKGTYTHEEHVTHKGYCQPKNNQPSDRSTNEPTKIEGQSVSIDGNIDRKNPDVISGSKTWGGEKSGSVTTFKYTVTWSFRRNPGELEIENIAFDEHPYPDFNSWKENTEDETVDSNIVRIRAKIVNYSRETKFPKIEFKETKENITLPDGETSISIGPGEQREVEYIWDTSGYAWGVGAKPMSDRTIKVELTDKEKTEKTRDISVIPRPVVLVHGLWADYTAWDGYDRFLYKAHSVGWHSYAVGVDPENGVMNTGEKGSVKPTNTIVQNAAELAKQIEFIQKKWNAWHIDAVAHSMGGIITRSYINDRMKVVPDGKPTIEHLVQLGTPNEGSPCANLISRTIVPLGIKDAHALNQLDKGYMSRFNQVVLNRKGTWFSNLIGTIVPATCISPQNGDGVVEWSSAMWQIRDVRFVPQIHTKLTDEEYFRNFVLKRLAITRFGNHAPDKSLNLPPVSRLDSGETRFDNAAYLGRQDADEPQDFKINAAKQVSVKPGQTTEVEIPASEPGRSGVTFVAPASVSATLVDEKGSVVAKNTAGTPEAASEFRTLMIDKQMNGVWKLKLENTGKAEAGAIVSAWTGTAAGPISFTVSAGSPSGGQVLITAKLTNQNSPVVGATVTVRVQSDDDKSLDLSLADDGQHGDGAAGDGVYAVTTEKLPSGYYSVAARAEGGGQTYLSANGFRIEDIASTPAVKAVQKRPRK